MLNMRFETMAQNFLKHKKNKKTKHGILSTDSCIRWVKIKKAQENKNRRPPLGAWGARKVRLYVKAAAAVTRYLPWNANMAGDGESLESCLSKFPLKNFAYD